MNEIEKIIKEYAAERRVDWYTQVAFYVHNENEEDADFDWWNQCQTFETVKVVEKTTGEKVAMWIQGESQRQRCEEALHALNVLSCKDKN